MDEIIGKTVETIDKGDNYIVITFTDGSKIEVGGRGGSDSLWLEVNVND